MFLRINGEQSGPFTSEDVARRFRRGELSGCVMSWCAGESRWTSLKKRWPDRRSIKGPALGATLAVTAAVSGVAIAFSQLAPLPFSAQTGGVLVIAAAACLGMALAGIVWSWLADRSSNRRNLVTVLASVLAVGISLWTIGLTALTYSVLQARQAAPNAAVTFDGATNAISIRGRLGARLVLDVRSALQAHPRSELVVLDSEGGLVADALDAATLIRAKGVTVRVDGACASACVAIWAAAASRQMTTNSRVGIHDLTMVGDLPSELSDSAKADLKQRYGELLRQAGFSQQVVTRADSTPASSMYWMNPLEVASAGAKLTIVDEAGTPVTRAAAKWAWVETVTGRSTPLSRLMEALALHAPAIANAHSDELYAAATQSDPGVMKTASAALYADAASFTMARATDSAVVAWARAVYNSLGRMDGAATSCALVMNAMGTQTEPQLQLSNAVTNALRGLVETVSEATPPSPAVSDDSPTVVATSRQAWDRVMHSGHPTDSDKWSAADWCGYRLAYLGYALQLPIHPAAEAVRNAYSADAGHRFRSMPATNSGACRPGW